MAAEALQQVWHPEIKTTRAFRASLEATQKIPEHCPSALHRLAWEGAGPRVPKIFPVVREGVPGIRMVESSCGSHRVCNKLTALWPAKVFSWVSCSISTGERADPRTGLSPSSSLAPFLADTLLFISTCVLPQRFQRTPFLFLRNFISEYLISSHCIFFALSAFLIPISPSLYHLCCCPSFQSIPETPTAALFCSRPLETQIL